MPDTAHKYAKINLNKKQPETSTYRDQPVTNKIQHCTRQQHTTINNNKITCSRENTTQRITIAINTRVYKMSRLLHQTARHAQQKILPLIHLPMSLQLWRCNQKQFLHPSVKNAMRTLKAKSQSKTPQLAPPNLPPVNSIALILWCPTIYFNQIGLLYFMQLDQSILVNWEKCHCLPLIQKKQQHIPQEITNFFRKKNS